MDKTTLVRHVIYYETDKMGVVHHTNYIRFFEEARIKFMHEIGCDVRELEDLGVIIPNVDAYAKYKKPLRFYDEFYVETKLIEFNGAKMKYQYEVKFCENDEVASVGYTTHCFVNQDFKPISIKRVLPEKYDILLKNLTK